MKSNLRNFLKFCFMIIIFFIILDSTVGKYVYKKYVREQLLDINPNFSKIDEIYDHKFPKNFNAIGGWGNLRYKLCTDNNGFRTACNKKEKSIKKFDIAFIGDSFTEGLGYDYEQTFVGIIEKKLFDKKIANLSMSSYSPSIYYTKLKKLISEGYEFDEVIVFLDLSDLTDDILCYKVINDQRVVRRNTFETCFNNFNAKEKNKFSQFIERHLKFTHIFLSLFDKKEKENSIKFLNAINHSRAEWTYNYNKRFYNNMKLDESIEISKKSMENLYKLLKKNSIHLSVAVYPWPGTLKYDQLDNKQFIIWKNFCEDKCKKFYNFMPVFFENFNNKNFYDSYLKFFIKNDFHFNEEGNKLIAESFLIQYQD